MSEYLEKWQHPENYSGFPPIGDYVIYTRHRDSSILENVNYDLILAELEKLSESLPGPNDGENWAYDWRASHWAVGWVETIIVRSDSPAEIIECAESIVCALADYPVYSDEAYSEAQYQAINCHWDSLDIGDRVDLCYEAGDSIFSARHDCAPENVFNELSNCEGFY